MRRCDEQHFETMDGLRLFYRHWATEARPTEGERRAVVLLHRGHEHSGRIEHLADELQLPGHAIFAWDARGHGRSPGARGFAPSFGTLTKDLDLFVRHITETHGVPIENISVIAQSIGSVIAATWVHDFAPNIRCMILAAPAFKIKLYVPLARPMLRAARGVIGDFAVQSYIKPQHLTHDADRIASYRNDARITRAISVKLLLQLQESSDRIVEDAQAIHVPTQLLLSQSDWVVEKKPQMEFFHRLGSARKEIHEFADFYHDTLGERDRSQAIDKAREFIQRTYDEPVAPASLLDADRHGPMKDEFDRLSTPLPKGTVRALGFQVIKRAVKAGARLSEGLRLGQETGFDSGSTLDYVYRDLPHGSNGMGKAIDRIYLNSPGWRGIRARKRHVEQTLQKAIALAKSRHERVRILDIAAGRGRYVLDAIGRSDVEVLLRDYDPRNVREGAALITSRGLEQFATFEKGDAFDRQSLAAITPRTHIGMVCGLYELFPENDQLRESLAGLAEAIESNGYLIYTGQPWHPQLEFIARTLPSHRDHKPWVMRRRTQAELDQLVEAAGFHKIDQFTDDGGMFTVSLAQRSETRPC
jgi:alpha-beta hydrolase superfamily lysophospholipase